MIPYHFLLPKAVEYIFLSVLAISISSLIKQSAFDFLSTFQATSYYVLRAFSIFRILFTCQAYG
jgi:hypothetical protein